MGSWYNTWSSVSVHFHAVSTLEASLLCVLEATASCGLAVSCFGTRQVPTSYIGSPGCTYRSNTCANPQCVFPKCIWWLGEQIMHWACTSDGELRDSRCSACRSQFFQTLPRSSHCGRNETMGYCMGSRSCAQSSLPHVVESPPKPADSSWMLSTVLAMATVLTVSAVIPRHWGCFNFSVWHVKVPPSPQPLLVAVSLPILTWCSRTPELGLYLDFPSSQAGSVSKPAWLQVKCGELL
jgi:hypothetical protein